MRFTKRGFGRHSHTAEQSAWGRLLWSRTTRAVQARALDALEATASRSQQMMDSAAATRRGTRKRALPVIAGGFAALAGMFTLVSNNVLAVNFTTADKAMQINTNYITGISAAGYLDSQKKAGDGTVGVAEVGFKTARLSGLCAIADQDLGPLLGTYSIMITAGVPVADPLSSPGSANVTKDGNGDAIKLVGGDGKDAGALDPSDASLVTATNLFLSASALSGYGNKISGLLLGQNAADVKAKAEMGDVPDSVFGSTATDGAFGLEADYLNVSGTQANSYGINLQGQILLPQLRIKVLSGSASDNRGKCDTEAGAGS